MEQKSMFKRLLSFVVIFTMLFSSFVILAAPAFAADEAADAGKYNAGLNIELSDNEQLLNIDDAAAIKLLTDGDWALNAEAWGGNTNGVVLVQNKNATQQNAWGQANFIWKFEDTPDPYNSIKFGFYSDVNSMIGYPTEEDVWFSNNGVDWVSGYSSSDIGYGETIPDAMTKFDGEATPAGTVIGEIKLRNPQTYKYVKIELYYPKSPFTEENGYVDGTAKPRWEFFGLTEVFDFDLVPTSTVVTDWNAHQYWEGRGGSNGSYAFNNAEDYAASSLTWWKHVAFAPVEGKENTYTIAGIREAGENPLLAFPEGGFVWCAWGDAGASTPGKAALNLFGTMTEGDIYVLTGFDVAGEFVQNDATVTKWVDPDAPANVALGSKYEIVGLAPSSSYPDTANKELTDGARVNGKYNEPGWVGVILTGTVRAFDVVVTLGDGETVYNIDKIIVNAGAKGATCGVTEPNFITYYSVDGETWTEFGTYTATDNADVMSVNATMEVATPVAAKYIKVNVSRPKEIGNLMWLGEIEAYGVEEPAKDKVSIVISGETNVIGGVDAAIEKLADGDWALDAEAWGGNTNGVVLIQNTAATDANKREAIHLIYEFAETPEAYNTIKLGLYSSVESMIGFPTEEDVYFSNDGETWVSGYDDIGYGETIPDAYTTFDGDPTKPGTVIAEVRIENPVTYKYVKLVLRYPESPFTEENGYGGEGNPAKPRWEFFGLTEIAFENVEVSSVITDFNASQYWESRYGRGAGSFAFTTAEEYKVAWDNFITSSYTQVAFAPVAGVENTYEVVVIGNSELTFPEGGFIWTAYNSAEAGSAAEAAINLFKSMTAGEQYTFTGIDFEKGFGEKDAKVEKYIAPVDPEPAVNVALGSKYEIVGLTPSGSYPDTDNKELTDGARVEGKYNDSGWVGVILTSTVRSFDVVVTLGDGETVYNIDKIVVNAGAAGCTCGVTEPELKAFYSVDGSEWLEFGSYTATGTDATNVNATMTVDAPVAAKYIKVNVGKATGAGNLMWLGEIEAYGAEAPADPEPPVVEDGYKVDGDLKEWGDEWTEVTPDNGYWQNIPKTEDTLSYKYQLYTDDTKLYAAFEIDCAAVAGGNGKGTNVRFWIRSDDEATVYTHFYDVFVGGTGAKYNASKTENKGAAIENSTINAVLVTEGDKTYVEFSIDLAEFNGAEGFDYYVCISNKVNENVCLYHPAVPEPAEGEYRLTNLPYNNWYVPSEEPTVGTKENPAVIEIMPGMRGYMGEGYATLKGGDEYYFTAIVPVDGNVNANFYVIDAEYNGYNVLYSLNGGELLDNYNYDNPGLDNLKAGDVVTIYVKVSDEAPDVDLTAMISLDAVGSMSNPEEIEAGEYTAEIGAGNWSGYNYEFVAEKDGYVKVTIADDNAGWVYSLSNVSAGIYGDMHYSDDETVVKADYVKVAAGETATINVSTYGGATTEGTVKFTVSFIPYVESFWTEEEDGRTAPDSNYNPAHAWGYEFDIAAVDPASTVVEGNIIITNIDTYKACGGNFQYLAHAFFKPTGVEGEYEVTKVINYPGTVDGVKLKSAAKVVEAGLVTEADFADGAFVLLSQSSASKPMFNEDYTIKYANWEQKVAVWALGKTIGAKATLGENTLTIEDKPVVDEGVTVVPNYNFKYAAGNTTILVPWTMGTTLESILDKQYEWFNFAVLTWDAEAGVYKVADVKLGTNIKASADPENGSDFGGLEIPEYGFILGAHSDDTVNHEAIEALKVGDVVYIYGTDLTNATQETALTDAVVTTKAIEGKDAFAPEIVVEPEKPVISVWGSGGTIDVLTDGYTGVGEVTKWEGNEAKLYGLSNNLLVKAEYDFTVAITESKFDAITLYALDYAGGGVMLPESVKFVVGDETFDAVITANENGIATIKAELGKEVTASEIKVLVVMGASPYTFPIFNMFTELEVNKVEDPKPTALLGDVNGNGEIEMYDYILVKRQIMNTIELTDVQMEVADVNGNGEIEMYDYILIKRHIMGTFVIGE